MQQISLGLQSRVERIRKKYSHELSTHAFTSLYIWKNNFDLQIDFMEDLYIIKRGDTGSNDYYFPCGSDHEKRLLFNTLLQKGKLSLYYIRDVDKQFLENHFPDRFHFIPARDDWEYIYDRHEQVELKGHAFKKLRSKVTKSKNYFDGGIIETLHGGNIHKAKIITSSWTTKKKFSVASADIEATISALDHLDELCLSGILFTLNGSPCAFAVGSTITQDTYDIHISKSLIPELDYYLKWELFKTLPGEINFINREDDMGIDGLRINKTEMNPCRFNTLWRGASK